MAKKTEKVGKITFGTRRTGKFKKSRSPKEKRTKKYRGQGR